MYKFDIIVIEKLKRINLIFTAKDAVEATEIVKETTSKGSKIERLLMTQIKAK